MLSFSSAASSASDLAKKVRVRPVLRCMLAEGAGEPLHVGSLAAEDLRGGHVKHYQLPTFLLENPMQQKRTRDVPELARRRSLSNSSSALMTVFYAPLMSVFASVQASEERCMPRLSQRRP